MSQAEELQALLLLVHRCFREQVATNQSSYERFVESFFFDNPIGHEKNATIVRNLLTTDEEMFIPCLLIEEFTKDDADAVIERYRHKGRSLSDLQRQYPHTARQSSDATTNLTTNTIPIDTIEQETLHSTTVHSLRPQIDDTGIDLIANYANEVFLFSDPVDAADIKHILKGTGDKTYHVKSNIHLRLLFDCLSSKHRIKRGWMTTLCKQQRLYSPRGAKRLLIPSDLYQLSEIQKEHINEYNHVWDYLTAITTLEAKSAEKAEKSAKGSM